MGQYHVLYDDSLAQERTTPSRFVVCSIVNLELEVNVTTQDSPEVTQIPGQKHSEGRGGCCRSRTNDYR